MAVDPIELSPHDSKRLREEAARRGVEPEYLAHEAVDGFLQRRRLGFVGIIKESPKDFQAAETDDFLEREGFGGS